MEAAIKTSLDPLDKHSLTGQVELAHKIMDEGFNRPQFEQFLHICMGDAKPCPRVLTRLLYRICCL
jgi:hypothetical protein